MQNAHLATLHERYSLGSHPSPKTQARQHVECFDCNVKNKPKPIKKPLKSSLVV